MTPPTRFWLPLWLSFVLVACHPSRQTLRLHELPNYRANAPQQLLFLDFAIHRAGADQPERVALTNAIVGQGERKVWARAAHSPCQIRFERVFTDNRPAETDSVAHPLFQTLELPDTDGTLSRRPMQADSGHVSVRLPYVTALTRINLYSVTPDRGTRRMHTIRLKP